VCLIIRNILNVRQAIRTTLPVGGGPDGTSPVFIPKVQEIGYSVYVMQRREDIWGPDAAIFNPDRWADKKVGWEYLPFNGGPRICIGQQFALTEVGYVLTRLVQKFDKMENCDEQNKPIHQYSVTSAPKQVLVWLHEACRPLMCEPTYYLAAVDVLVQRHVAHKNTEDELRDGVLVSKVIWWYDGL
jgi:hypothetical protein